MAVPVPGTKYDKISDKLLNDGKCPGGNVEDDKRLVLMKKDMHSASDA